MNIEPSNAAPCCNNGTAYGLAGWLSLAATPAFGIMAAYTGLSGGSDMICSNMPDAFSPSGMAMMYALMSVFHAAPWVTLLARRIVWLKARPAV